MTRDNTLAEIRKYFSIEELVCPHVAARWGDRAWQFLETEYLSTLLVIRRDILQVPMSCNGGSFSQRGLRCNICDLVRNKARPYLSSHILGKAGDFTVSGITAEAARTIISENAELLPHPIRLESDVSWLHIDTLPQMGVTTKVYHFKA